MYRNNSKQLRRFTELMWSNAGNSCDKGRVAHQAQQQQQRACLSARRNNEKPLLSVSTSWCAQVQPLHTWISIFRSPQRVSRACNFYLLRSDDRKGRMLKAENYLSNFLCYAVRRIRHDKPSRCLKATWQTFRGSRPWLITRHTFW